MHSGNAAAMPLVRNDATFSFCHASRSVRITTAILVSNCMRCSGQTASFRDGPKDQTSDVQLHIGESRDSGLAPSGASRNDDRAIYPLASQAQARITHSLPPNS